MRQLVEEAYLRLKAHKLTSATDKTAHLVVKLLTFIHLFHIRVLEEVRVVDARYLDATENFLYRNNQSLSRSFLQIVNKTTQRKSSKFLHFMKQGVTPK